MPYDPRDIRIEPRYADNQPFITIGQQEIPITRPQQRMIPIQPPEPDLPIWQVNEGDYDQLGYQTNLGDLQNLMDYTTTAPAKGALMGIAKNDGVLNQLYGGLKGLLKSYTKHPKEAPSGKAIAKEFGLDNETFRSKAFGGNIDPELYPNVSPADIGGFGIDMSADLSNLVPLGAVAGMAKKGSKVGDFLYHGTPNKIKGGALKLGGGDQLKKGGYMGGHFLSDELDIAKGFSFGGDVYTVPSSMKEKAFNINENKKYFQDFIGKKYPSEDEMLEFTKQDYDAMFPQGDADWSTINQDLVEYVAKKEGKTGVAVPEFAYGKKGTTYQFFDDEIPINPLTESSPMASVDEIPFTKKQLDNWEMDAMETETGDYLKDIELQIPKEQKSQINNWLGRKDFYHGSPYGDINEVSEGLYLSSDKGVSEWASNTRHELGGNKPNPFIGKYKIKPKNPYYTSNDIITELGYNEKMRKQLKDKGHDIIMSADGSETVVLDPSVIIKRK